MIQSHMEKRALRKSVLWHDPDAPRIPPPERGSAEERRRRMLERREKIRVEREQARAKQARHAPKKYADAPKLVHPAEVYRKKKDKRQASQARKAAYLQRGLSKPNPNALSDHARESFRKAQEARGKLAPEKPLEGAWSDPNSPPW
jgi:hypothetical protein